MSAWQLPWSMAKLTRSSASTPGKRLVICLKVRKDIFGYVLYLPNRTCRGGSNHRAFRPSLPARHERGESRRERGSQPKRPPLPDPLLLVGGEGEEARTRSAQSQVLSKYSSQFESDLELPCFAGRCQLLSQPSGPIGRDAVHAGGHQFAGLCWRVHSPDVNFQARSSELFDQCRIHRTARVQIEAIHPDFLSGCNQLFGSRRPASSPPMAPELADPTHLQTRHFRFKLAHRFAREANGDHRPRSLARVFCRPLELRNAFGATFEFNENPLAVGNRREDCCECGNFLTGPSFALPTSHVDSAQFIERLCTDFPGEAARTFGVVIMDDHQLAVLGKLNVNFDGIGLLLPREPDGS